MCPNPQKTAELAKFTEEILNEKHFCAVYTHWWLRKSSLCNVCVTVRIFLTVFCNKMFHFVLFCFQDLVYITFYVLFLDLLANRKKIQTTSFFTAILFFIFILQCSNLNCCSKYCSSRARLSRTLKGPDKMFEFVRLRDSKITPGENSR